MARSARARLETEEVSDRERLKRYLRRHSENGEHYFKSKFIADELGMSPSQIGALLPNLQEAMTDVEIERWAYTGATTWRITPRNTED